MNTPDFDIREDGSVIIQHERVVGEPQGIFLTKAEADELAVLIIQNRMNR